MQQADPLPKDDPTQNDSESDTDDDDGTSLSLLDMFFDGKISELCKMDEAMMTLVCFPDWSSPNLEEEERYLFTILGLTWACHSKDEINAETNTYRFNLLLNYLPEFCDVFEQDFIPIYKHIIQNEIPTANNKIHLVKKAVEFINFDQTGLPYSVRRRPLAYMKYFVFIFGGRSDLCPFCMGDENQWEWKQELGGLAAPVEQSSLVADDVKKDLSNLFEMDSNDDDDEDRHDDGGKKNKKRKRGNAKGKTPVVENVTKKVKSTRDSISYLFQNLE